MATLLLNGRKMSDQLIQIIPTLDLSQCLNVHKGKSLSIWMRPVLEVALQLGDPAINGSHLQRLRNTNLREAYSTFKDTTLWSLQELQGSGLQTPLQCRA